MAMDTEEMIRAQPMDAVILIGGCDKTLPAQVMAAASSEVPAIFLPTGPMMVGDHRGERIGACTDCRRLWSMFRAGRLDQTEIDAVNGQLVPSVGTCAVMGTASTMACLTEAMGLCLPMAASAPAVAAERVRLAEDTGRRAVELATGNGPTVRDLLSDRVLHNALVALQAIGGSTNAVVHLAAFAGRLGLKLDLTALDDLGRRVPTIVDLKPSGDHYMEDFHKAGGMPRVLSEVAAELHLDAPTVAGGTLRDVVDGAMDMPGQKVIRSVAAPLKPVGAIAVLSGNLAPRGAVIKQSAASDRFLKHTGRAVVFDSVDDMTAHIDDPNLDVGPNDILVLRNAGPKGAPGMPEAGYLPIPRKLARQGITDMVRISDARMSGTAFGTVVLHVTPEAADGGPLAAVETGDSITLDVEARRIDVLIDDAVLKARLAALPAPAANGVSRGYARLYREHVLQADDGADFDFLVPPRARDGRPGDPT
jgi:dihydroxy-acid dehydratase